MKFLREFVWWIFIPSLHSYKGRKEKMKKRKEGRKERKREKERKKERKKKKIT